MNDILFIFLALPAGFVLGLFYFGSLWITVRQLPTTQWPVRLFIGSYLSRLAIAAFGFYLIVGGRWERGLVSVLGFWLARLLLVHRLAPKSLNLERSVKE